jgi:probable rRNA maturation factor
MVRTPLRELSIALVGEARMSRLHQQFMNIAGPTDVLTFPLELDNRNRCICGEVIICVPVALREARKRGIPPAKEVLLYALHGMLHLSGFDDRTADAFRTMHRKEDQILTALGLGPVFEALPYRRSRASARRGLGA